MSEQNAVAGSVETPQPLKKKDKDSDSGSDIISIVTSTLCLILIGFISYSLFVHFTVDAVQERIFTLDHEANTFLMDGKPFRYVSGSIHYFRAVPEAWHKRLRSMKAAGLNVIDTYVEWSLHNPHDGVYDWSGIADVERFIRVAQREGFYVILRPGPYICAERDNGGLPHWLFGKYPGIQMRTSDANYTQEVALWYSKLMPRIQPFLYGNGGPIIMVQVENEYNSYSACDYDYMKWLRDETLKYTGDKALLYTTDYPEEDLKCGIIENVFVTVDLGVDETHDLDKVWRTLRKFQPTGPLVVSEFYAGWLTHWNEKNQRIDPESVAIALDKILAANASVSLYMFYGGTNFGFTAGANDYGDNFYTPDITSYEYDAVMDERGNTTRKYQLVREVIGKYFRVPGMKPVREKTMSYGKIELKPILNLLDKHGRMLLGNSDLEKFHRPKTFEELDQFSGLVLYETNITSENISNSRLIVNKLRDRALVYVDEEFVGILSRETGTYFLNLNKTSGSTLQILVENQGRINYNIANDTKGILGSVVLEKSQAINTTLENWSHTGYSLEGNDIKKLLSSQLLIPLTENSNFLTQGPRVYYAEFVIKKAFHTYLNPSGWGKGVAYVNGFNLGRYWPLAGPQLTLYIPQEILVRGQNTLVLIEYEQTNSGGKDLNPYVTLDNKPQLDN